MSQTWYNFIADTDAPDEFPFWGLVEANSVEQAIAATQAKIDSGIAMKGHIVGAFPRDFADARGFLASSYDRAKVDALLAAYGGQPSKTVSAPTAPGPRKLVPQLPAEVWQRTLPCGDTAMAAVRALSKGGAS